MSITHSIAPSAVSSPGSRGGNSIFGRWSKSYPTPSIISTSTTTSSLQDRFDELKEVSDLNRSTLQRLANDLATKDQECMELRKSDRMLRAELEQTIETLQHSVQSKDQISRDLATSNEQLTSLQHENDVLANLAAAAEATISKYNTYIDTFKQQYQTLTTVSAQEQHKHKQQVDAMGAQQSEAEERFQAQLQDKDTVIRSLQAQLKHSKLTAAKATSPCDDEVAHPKDQTVRELVGDEVADDKVANLVDQLRRVRLDRDDASRLAETWREFATRQQSRTDALEAEIANLKAQGAVV
jgi:chromosome segregation ATPase